MSNSAQKLLGSAGSLDRFGRLELVLRTKIILRAQEICCLLSASLCEETESWNGMTLVEFLVGEASWCCQLRQVVTDSLTEAANCPDSRGMMVAGSIWCCG